MTVVMGKQHVYSQHQSMFCTLWWAFPQQRIGGQFETPHDYHALTNNLTIALAFSYLSTPLNLSIWSAGKYFLAPSQLLFCDTLSREGKGWSRLALDSNLLSDSPETSFFLNVYSSPFFSSCLGQLHTLPQASSSPMSREPRPRPYHASKCPLLLALRPLRSPWL